MNEYPYPKASIKHRFGQYLLEGGLFFVTFGIGYIIWTLLILDQGQTPGKQILKLRVYSEVTGKPAKWPTMFYREFGLGLLLVLSSYLLTIFLGLESTYSISEYFSNPEDLFSWADLIVLIVLCFDAFWIFRNDNRKRLVDVVCMTDVLNEAK